MLFIVDVTMNAWNLASETIPYNHMAARVIGVFTEPSNGAPSSQHNVEQRQVRAQNATAMIDCVKTVLLLFGSISVPINANEREGWHCLISPDCDWDMSTT